MPGCIRAQGEVTCPKCDFSVMIEQYDGDKRTTLLSMERCVQCSCYSIQKTHLCPKCGTQFTRGDIRYCSGSCKHIHIEHSGCGYCTNKIDKNENCSLCPFANNSFKQIGKKKYKTPRSKQINKNVRYFNNHITEQNGSAFNRSDPRSQFPLATAFANALLGSMTPQSDVKY